MSIVPNASIGQFTAAYAGALSSLGVSCAPQLLHYKGHIVYGGEATGPDEPLIKIDGSRSTAARDEYVMLSVPKEQIFADPRERDVNLLNPTSPFLSEIDRFDEIVDSTTINVVAEYALPAHKGPSVSTLKVKLSELKLRDVLKALSDPDVTDEYREGIKRAAHIIANDADNIIGFGKGDELKAAETFFVAGILFAGLKDDESNDIAIRMVAESARLFYATRLHHVAAAAVTEILPWLMKDDPKRRDAFLVQAADRWEEVASALHREGDIFGASIAVYRGLRAAALSKHYDAMRILFALSAEINGEKKNTGEQTRDYLRSTLATFNTYIHGANSDENRVWKEACSGLYLAIAFAKEQNVLEAIAPFMTAAQERAGR